MFNLARITKNSQRIVHDSLALSRNLSSAVQPNRNPNTDYNKLFINNEYVDAKDGKCLETVNPANGKVITKVAAADSADVDLAVAAAKKAFSRGSPWRTSSGKTRSELMLKLSDLMERDRAHLASLESIDNGKPYKIAYNVDVPGSINCLRYYAGWADKIQGKTIPVHGDFMAYTRHEPVGVAGQIIPWNFPLLMMAWKIGPVLATGCTTIVKAAEQTPLTALYMGKLIAEAGFPPGVVNVLSGYGPTAGAALVNHPDVDKIAFTGSTEIGKLIARQAADSLKRVTLELGGKSPNIIMGDLKGADLDYAVAQSSFGLFFNHGQCCCAGSRIFVQENIYDEFVAKSVEAAKKIRVGDPFDNSTDQGPQVDENQLKTIMNYIKSGKKEGASLLTGGAQHGNEGYFVEPTVFADVKDDMKICQEEIFGPVMQILKFKTTDEVIDRANNNIYGLAASVFTKNIDSANEVSSQLRAGSVWINCYDVFDAALPFGGYKHSGYGREKGEYGLNNYLEVKCVTTKVPSTNN